ncbi:recombinase family protein [Clostridium estertheticum]|uniref:recombinase family protein n=1 Tax=Clostridium estertheticum TaxID=238834 RepID=UPI0013E922AC|nr:recombinase family protein [Clostridium estertheticum]MBZ9688455.1 recombinase family protein [Clostridium estertheticum]
MVVKYMRVSTKQQTIGRQDFQLDKLNVIFDRSYIDKMTGKVKDRPQLNKMIVELSFGDVVYCESITRLGRSLKDLIEIMELLIAKGVRVLIVKEGIDSDSSTYKLLIGIFGSIGELERESIQERVIQGIEKCKATRKTSTGKWFGRVQLTKNDLSKTFEKYYIQLMQGSITKVEMAKLLGIGRATLYRWLELYEK